MTIEFTITTQQSREDAFSFWVDKDKLKKWLISDVDKSSIQPRKKGKYWLYINDTHNTNECTIQTIYPNQDIEFTWKGPKEFEDFLNYRGELTIVKVNFEKIDDKTKISLQHYGWRSSEDYQNARKWHISFWENKLEKLSHVLEKK